METTVTTKTYATAAQMTELERRAVNDVTREIADRGVLLSESQADRLGEVGLDWMRGRLGLRLEMDSDGDISLAPRVDEGE